MQPPRLAGCHCGRISRYSHRFPAPSHFTRKEDSVNSRDVLEDRCCDRPSCFQARLEATAGTRAVTRDTRVCAEHLGGAVRELTAWARERQLRGQLTLLVIDRPGAGHRAQDADPAGFAFAAITLAP